MWVRLIHGPFIPKNKEEHRGHSENIGIHVNLFTVHVENVFYKEIKCRIRKMLRATNESSIHIEITSYLTFRHVGIHLPVGI